MEDAKRIAVAGYRQVLEDGPEVCDSESGHGEMWSHAEMYTPDMLGPDGKPLTGGPLQLSAVQANSMRAAAKLAVSQPSVSTAFSSSPVTSRPPTPMGSDADDSEETTEDQQYGRRPNYREGARENGYE
jgi:hypothetical protein